MTVCYYCSTDIDVASPGCAKEQLHKDFDPTAFDIAFDPTKQRMEGWTRHGNFHFDVPFMSHVIDTMWQGGCQDRLILPQNIQHLVSLYIWEAYDIKHDIETKLYIKMYDSEDQPDWNEVIGIAAITARCMDKGDTLVHCQAGLNRSSLIAATALWLRGMNAGDAVDLLREKRSEAVLCNPVFDSWVRNLDNLDRPNAIEVQAAVESVLAR